MNRGRHRKRGGRTTPKGTRPPQRTRPFGHDSEPDFVRQARSALRDGPVPLTLMAAGLVESSTPRRPDSLLPTTPDISLAELLETLVDSEFGPLHALCAATLPMVNDELLRHRLEQHGRVLAATRAHPWLATLARPRLDGVVATSHTLGDGENVMIGVSWPDGWAATALVYVDHNMGTVVKDAFVAGESVDYFAAQWAGLADDPHITVSELDGATARACLSDAISVGDMMLPPVETDTWPLCRPVIEWFMTLLPSGGQGFEWKELAEADREALATRFAGSSFAENLRPPTDVVRELADDIIWLAAGFHPYDAMRWSPVLVEIMLVDLVPRKVHLADEKLRHVPEVISAFIRFAHAERDIPADLTAEASEAVARWTPEFIEALSRPRLTPEQNAARLARIAAGLDPDDVADDDLDDDLWDDDWTDDVDDFDLAGYVDEYEARLLDEVGGPEGLADLDDTPLADRPFDWSSIGDADRDLVADTLAKVDAVCDELLDVEMRTICRTYLAALVATDTNLYERSQRTDLIAGGLAWAALRMQAGYRPLHASGLPQVMLKDIAAVLDVKGSSLSQRASLIEGVLGDRAHLDHRRLWHSSRRRDYLEQLETIRQWRAQTES